MPDWTFASPWQQLLKDVDVFPVSLWEGWMKVICRSLFCVVSLVLTRLSCPVLPISTYRRRSVGRAERPPANDSPAGDTQHAGLDRS